MDIEVLKKKIMTTPLERAIAKYYPKNVVVQNDGVTIMVAYKVPVKGELGDDPDMKSTEVMIMSLNGSAFGSHQLDVDASVKLPELVVLSRRVMLAGNGRLDLIMTYKIKDAISPIMRDPIAYRIGEDNKYDLGKLDDPNIPESMKHILHNAYKNTTIANDIFNPFIYTRDFVRANAECEFGIIIRNKILSKTIGDVETNVANDIANHAYFYLVPLTEALIESIAILLDGNASALVDVANHKLANYQFIIDITKFHEFLNDSINAALYRMVSNNLIPMDCLKNYEYNMEDTVTILARMLMTRFIAKASTEDDSAITFTVPHFQINQENDTTWRFNVELGEGASFSTTISDDVSEIINGEFFLPHVVCAAATSVTDSTNNDFMIPSMEFRLSVSDNFDLVNRLAISTIAASCADVMNKWVDGRNFINYMDFHDYSWNSMAKTKKGAVTNMYIYSKLTTFRRENTYINAVRSGRVKAPVNGMLHLLIHGECVHEINKNDQVTNNSYVISDCRRAINYCRLLNTDTSIRMYRTYESKKYIGYAINNVIVCKNNALGTKCNVSIYMYDKIANNVHESINSAWPAHILIASDNIPSEAFNIIRTTFRINLEEEPFMADNDVIIYGAD